MTGGEKEVNGDRRRPVVGSYMMPIAIGILVGAVLRSVVKSDALCFALVIIISFPVGLLAYNLLTRYWRKQDGEKR